METSDAAPALAALRRNHDDLAERARAFAADDLRRTSGASEWTVAQVLSHLGSGAEIMRASLDAALGRREPLGDDFNPSVWACWDASSPEDQAEGFVESDDALVRAFEELDEATRRDLRVDLGFLPQPADVPLLAAMRLGEVVLHGWDVRVTDDAGAGLAAEDAGLLLDAYTGPLGFLVGFLGKPEQAGEEQRTIRVRTSDPDRTLGLALGPEVGLRDDPAEPAGELVVPAEAFVRLLAGRLHPEHTPRSVELTGGATTLDQLRAVFPGM